MTVSNKGLFQNQLGNRKGGGGGGGGVWGIFIFSMHRGGKTTQLLIMVELSKGSERDSQ